jgi:superfamily II DNA or RNA helicase
MTNDPRRRFNKNERDALYMAADGKSEISGEPLPSDWHADHEKPWSKGGATDVGNAQALLPDENISKSDEWGDQRNRFAWQDEFVEHYRLAPQRDYLLAALPGSGKTKAANRVAREYRDTFPASKIIVVVPSRHLRHQWRKAAAMNNVQLASKDFSGNLIDFDGVVATYDAVHSNRQLYKRLCNKHPCFVIFDEIHHAAERKAWGEAISFAFESADRRLHLSGTPFKSDGQKIAFLRVGHDGKYQCDFTYDYPTALRDGVLRTACFHRYSGEVSVAIDDQLFTWHTDDELSDTDAARRLRGLLRSRSFTHEILLEAKRSLDLLRLDKPDAGGLVACIDIAHANVVADLIAKIEGQRPDIATSDDENASHVIEAFATSHRKWLVSVKMVSEGVDIPRLMVLAFLTNTTTELFFRQIVARVLRNQNTEFDSEAHVFMPDVEPLTDYAATIEQFQDQIVGEEDDEPSGLGAPPRQSKAFDVLDATAAQFAGLTARGVEHDLPSAAQIKAFAEQFHVAPSVVAAILKLGASGQSAPKATPAEDREAERDRLRTGCNKKATIIARLANIDFREVHLKYLKTVDGTRQPHMSIAQLKAKFEWLTKWHNELSSPKASTY